MKFVKFNLVVQGESISQILSRQTPIKWNLWMADATIAAKPPAVAKYLTQVEPKWNLSI